MDKVQNLSIHAISSKLTIASNF